VRYTTKPEAADENQRLIALVFDALRAASPPDVRYMVLRLGDGTFVHVATAGNKDGPNPLTQLDAFRTFQGGVKERCLEPPKASEAIVVGHYRMLDE
jgi:hypothetical protein